MVIIIKKIKILDWILAETLNYPLYEEHLKISISFDFITCSIILFHDSQTHGHKNHMRYFIENGIYGHQPRRILFAKFKEILESELVKHPKWNFAPMAHKNCASR